MLAQITANDQTAKREGVLVAKASVDLKDDRIDDIEDVSIVYWWLIREYRKKRPPDTRYQMGYRDAHVELRRLPNRQGQSSRRA